MSDKPLSLLYLSKLTLLTSLILTIFYGKNIIGVIYNYIIINNKNCDGKKRCRHTESALMAVRALMLEIPPGHPRVPL